MLFEIKKAIGALLMPLPFSLLLILCGVLLFVIGRRKLGTLGGLLGVALILLCSFRPFAESITKPLERASPAYAGQPVAYVVVLGGSHVSDDFLPVSSLLSTASLYRLVEGIRIYDLNEGSKLVLSGYEGNDREPNAKIMQRVARSLSVPQQDILIEPRPKDTREEAELIANIVDRQPFALVTSASHMKRAMTLFEQQGLTPLAAPTFFTVKNADEHNWRYYLPSPDALAMTHMAWHEYLGRCWAWLTS